MFVSLYAPTPRSLFASAVVPSVAKCSLSSHAASETACNELLFAASSFQKRLATKKPIADRGGPAKEDRGDTDQCLLTSWTEPSRSQAQVKAGLQVMIEAYGLSDARRKPGDTLLFSDTAHGADGGGDLGDSQTPRPLSSEVHEISARPAEAEEKFFEDFDFLTDLNAPEVIVSETQQPEVEFDAAVDDAAHTDTDTTTTTVSSVPPAALRRSASGGKGIRRQRPMSAVERGLENRKRPDGSLSAFDNQLGNQAKLFGSVPAMNLSQGSDDAAGGFDDDGDLPLDRELGGADGELPNARLAVDTDSLMSESRISLVSSNRSVDETRDDLKTLSIDHVHIVPVAGALPAFANHLDTTICAGSGIEQQTWQLTRQAVSVAHDPVQLRVRRVSGLRSSVMVTRTDACWFWYR
jgi:hypothetical protein